LVIRSLPFHGGDVGYSYRPVTAVGEGGKQPYKWSISPGTYLPPGLSMSTDGVTIGTPTTLGTYGFNVHLEDAAGNAQGFGSSIAINPPVSAAARCPNVDVPCRVESGCVEVCGALGTQNDGSAPYQYSAKGTLPAGTMLRGLALAGTFTTPSPNYTFTITVTDDAGASASFQDVFYVFPHISIDGPYSFAFKVGNVPSSVQVKYTAPNFFASNINTTGNPPSTPYLDQNQPYIDIAIPPPRQPVTWKFDVTIGDTYDCAANLKCSTTATVVITVSG
jgi:hypothetical protein